MARRIAIAALLAAGPSGTARAVPCNVPEPGNCYYEGVIVDCGTCDPDPAPAPASEHNAYIGISRPVVDAGIDTAKQPAPTKPPAPTKSCKLVREGWHMRTVCTDTTNATADTKVDKKESSPTQGEAVLRAATVSALGAVVKLAEGDAAGASTILIETDELVERAGRIGIPREMSLDYMYEGEAAALSERFSGITSAPPTKLAEFIASSAGSRSPRPRNGFVKAFLREQPGGEELARGDQGAGAAGEPAGPPLPSARSGGASGFNPASYAGTRAYLEQMGYGGEFDVSHAPPPGLYRPSRPRRSAEAEAQELGELKSMLRSIALRRLGREPAAEELGHSLFERVSRRIRILAPELEKN